MFLNTSEMSPSGPAALALGVFEMMFMKLSIGMWLLICFDLYCMLELSFFCTLCLGGV